MDSKKNYNTVSRIVLGAFLVALIASLVVTKPEAHLILRYITKGVAAAYIILVILYYAKPSLFGNKTKQQHG